MSILYQVFDCDRHYGESPTGESQVCLDDAIKEAVKLFENKDHMMFIDSISITKYETGKEPKEVWDSDCLNKINNVL